MLDRLSNIYIILNNPRYPENIGACARCLKNTGFRHLRIVNPRIWDEERILKMATHEAADIIESAQIFHDLKDAVADLHYLVGTTARTGRKRRPNHTPRSIAASLVQLPQEVKVGILFGSEKWGLFNQELALCDSVVTIPTVNFSSINLAQSVMIICYEIMMAILEEHVTVHKPRPATVEEREGFYSHLYETFEAIGLFQKQTPSYWMRNARRLFADKWLTARDIKMMRGFLRQIIWAVENAR